MAEIIVNNPFLTSLALTLLHFTWQGLLIALSLKSALMFTSYKKPQLRYLLASVAMLANLLLPFITFFIIYKPDYLQLVNPLQLQNLTEISTAMSQHNKGLWYSDLIEFFPYLSVFWLITVFTLACKLLLELYSVNRLSHSAVVPCQDVLLRRFEQLASQLKLSKTPELLISLKTDVPMAIGWLKPVVLLPATMVTGLTPAQLDMLILHELAHIRRHDYLVNFIQTLVEILLFFHPAVLWVSNQMRNEREYCSDDMAVHASGDAIAYAHTLADTAALCEKHRHRSIPNMAMAASGGDLKQRVLRLVDHHHCSSTNHLGKWLASTAVLISIIWSSKHFIALPVLDLTSGTFNLNQAGSPQPKTSHAPVTAKNIPQTSIAQQLLGQDEVNTNKAVAFKKEVNLEQKFDQPIKNQTGGTVASADKTPLNNYPKDKSRQITISEKASSKNHAVKEIVANNRLLHTPKKSIAELAFERTDSNKQTSSLTNPYATKVASLVDESPEPAAPVSSHIYSRLDTLTNSPAIADKKTSQQAPANQSAKLISSIAPKYPATAKRRGIELDVTVHFDIDSKGKVQNIQFDTKNKVSYFRNAIRSAMAKWRFLPAKVNGKPVESRMSKIFSFNLKN